MPLAKDPNKTASISKDKLYSWIPFFEEMAEKLLQYEDRQLELIQMLKDIGITSGLSDKDETGKIELTEIDPFSFFCFFTKFGEDKRTELLSKVKPLLNIEAAVPHHFGGVPTAQAQNVKLFSYKNKRTKQDIPLLWELFKKALQQNIDDDLFDKVLKINGVGKVSITQNLFYIKPDIYFPIDSQTAYFLKSKNIPTSFHTFQEYQSILEQVKTSFDESFYELSYRAWFENQKPIENYWIFQANPELYDIEKALKDNVLKTWSVSSHKKSIKKGDKAILWVTGKEGGCFGLLEVTSKVEKRKNNQVELPYYTKDYKNQNKDRVSVEVIHDFSINPISKKHIKDLVEFDNFNAGNQGTNFKATQEQYESFLQLFQKTQQQIRFWKFSPGKDAYKWNEFYQKGIIALNFGNLEMGDIQHFQSYQEIAEIAFDKGKIKTKNSNEPKNLFYFKDANIGDIVFANKGTKTCIGVGVIEGEYEYHKDEDFAYRRKINWITDKVLEYTANDIEGKKSLFRSDTFSPTKQGKYIIESYLKTYPELREVFEKHGLIKSSSIFQEPAPPVYITPTVQSKKTIDTDLNTILYGPPGTGKTYHTIDLAAKIVGFDKGNHQQNLATFNQLLGNQIEFITFHQSFAYEDFVEGIKPQTVSNKNGDKTVTYDIEDGVFKRIVKRALQNTGDKDSQDQTEFERVFDLLKDEWEASDENEVEIPMSRVSFHVTDITKTYIAFRKASGGTAHNLAIDTLKKIYNKKIEFKSGLAAYYNPMVNYLKRQVDKLPKQNKSQAQNYVLIIDEINRGNISNIFGELITLIEPDKRMGGNHSLSVTLPYSKADFSIPSNLYIIGTMNTADRSVEALDSALRRRFSFIPKYPEAHLLKALSEKFEGELDIEKLLTTLNNRIEKLLNIDYGIGHSYFMVLEKATKPLKALRLIFDQKILPLLQEYFYGDYEKIGMVLGSGFVVPKYKDSKEAFHFGKGFTNAQYDFEEKEIYEFTKRNTWSIETFRSIYEN